MSQDIESARAKHQASKVLQVSHTLRAHHRAWFDELRQRANDGEPYVICHPTTPHEIFEALDIPYVIDAWYSGIVAARRQSKHYSDVLSAHGYHSGLRRYNSLGYAVVLDPDHPDKPWGGLPKAAGVMSWNSEGGSIELAEFWNVPFIGLDQPACRAMHPNWWDMHRWNWEDFDESYRIDFMENQFRRVVEFAERLAGKRMDYDRLAEVVNRVNDQEMYFDRIRSIMANSPKLPVRLGEVMSQTMGIQWHRGSKWALEQAKAFYEEVKARADAGKWICPNEKYRFMYVGSGLWQKLEFFNSFEESHGVVFVRSNYLSIASDGYLRFGAKNPLRALASRYSILALQMWIPPMGGAWAVHEARTHRVNASVNLDRKGRGVTFVTRALEEAGIPVLDIEADPVDANKWNDDLIRSQMIEFIEKRVARAEQ
jgi:hypothetical protein